MGLGFDHHSLKVGQGDGDARSVNWVDVETELSVPSLPFGFKSLSPGRG